ncbi:hypothetical protein [Bradyrhizobium sp. SYSU BS000235]|uniref:hypothetical protein n=1 Tax=Bradyrhizobium sp. SYSU BS000235 TaxID=3411332 RepID=UPI003C7110A6
MSEQDLERQFRMSVWITGIWLTIIGVVWLMLNIHPYWLGVLNSFFSPPLVGG